MSVLNRLAIGIAVTVVAGLSLYGSIVMRSQANISKEAKGKSFFDYSAAVENIEPVGDPIPVTPDLLEYGEWVFRGMCIGCHGIAGDGNGAVWELGDQYAKEHKLPRKPRDFTQATFKVRSTPSGSFPTDIDLFKSISRGLVADQDMPAFKYLPERDRWAVIAYIKTFSTLWEEEAEYQEDPIEVGEPPIPDEKIIAAGKKVYAKMKCAKCHGELGLGDGPSAAELEDDSGLKIVPRNFTDASQFVGGSDPASVYQTFNTGFDGTPMPSFVDFLNDEESWQLVWYVTSLRKQFDLHETRKKMMLERGINMQMAHAGTFNLSADIGITGSNVKAKDKQPEANAEVAVETAAAEANSSTAKPAKSIGDYEQVEVADGGSIQGKVIYNGSIKKRTVLPTKDKKVCGKSRKEPMVLVGEGGAVQDAVVYLKNVKAGKAWSEEELVVPKLDQVSCQFQPHVQVARQGQIDIINSDPVLHNTHGYYGTRTAFNVALPEQGATVSKILKRVGTVKVDCDAHGWMLGWVQVVDSPYYFQTSEDGTYEITDVPPGDYTLVVWQEFLGETEFPVTITAGESTDLEVELTK